MQIGVEGWCAIAGLMVTIAGCAITCLAVWYRAQKRNWEYQANVAKTLDLMRKTLRVLIQRVEKHEKRLDVLEARQQRQDGAD